MQGGSSTAAPRARAAISCTECHKRRKRCSEGQPCRNCARRYPPVECIYKPHPKRRPNASDSVNRADTGRSTSSQPGQQPEATRTLNGHTNGEASSQNAPMGRRTVPIHSGNTLPSRPIESQIPICGLVEKPPNILNHEVTSSDVLVMAMAFHDKSSVPPAFGSGIKDILPSLKVTPTASNAELFNIYTKILVPWLWTVDGNALEAPPGSWQSWIPFSVFSPMILYTNLHRAAIWREMVQPTAFRVEVNSKVIGNLSPECIVLKGKAITLLRSHLSSSGPDAFSDEAIATVACIIFNEASDSVLFKFASFIDLAFLGKWGWGIEYGTKDILPHIKVLCAMLKAKGGMSKLSSHAAWLLMIIHYRLAVVLEREPFAFPKDLVRDRFILDYRPLKSTFDSPLFLSTGSFAEKESEIGIHAITAKMLDDLTLVLKSVRSFVLDEDSEIERGDILQTAIEVQDHILSLRSANEPNHPAAKDYIYETCRLAAIIYLRTIINHVQFSKAWHPEELQEMFSAIILTPMHYWKPLSSVWLFVLLSINPPRDELYPGAMFKFFLKTSSFHMAAWDWQCWVNIMETYLALQRWIRAPRNLQVPNLWSPWTTSDVTDVEDIQSVYGMGPV